MKPIYIIFFVLLATNIALNIIEHIRINTIQRRLEIKNKAIQQLQDSALEWQKRTKSYEIRIAKMEREIRILTRIVKGTTPQTTSRRFG